MRPYRLITIFLLLASLCVLITTCSKDNDSETIRKETFIRDFNNEISADSLESVVMWLQEMGTRFALAGNHHEVAQKIKRRFIRIGFPEASIDSFMITKTYNDVSYQQWQYNVIATLEGNIYPDSICIIGAHYDDILQLDDPFSRAPGANDNASGIAAVFEIARVLKKNNYSPASSIEFIAFGSEELGLFGSSDYASKASGDGKKIRFMLNNDMIAYETGQDQSTWAVNILNYDNSYSLKREAELICDKFSIMNYYTDNKYNKQSDSYPFFMNGYKALFFFSDHIDPNYHSLLDLAENCNFEYCKKIVEINCAILVDKN